MYSEWPWNENVEFDWKWCYDKDFDNVGNNVPSSHIYTNEKWLKIFRKLDINTIDWSDYQPPNTMMEAIWYS